MVYSMTAFARAELAQGSLMLSWEIRSVNHRYLETQFRMPDALRFLEFTLRERLQKQLKRGKVDCTLKAEQQGDPQGLAVNQSALDQVLTALTALRARVPDMGAVDPLELLRWPGVLGDSVSLNTEGTVNCITDLFDSALVELIAHRGREGAKLEETISTRLTEIDSTAEELVSLTASMPNLVQEKLHKRLAELRAKLDEARLEQEVALLAQRADVAEELDRLRIHVDEARNNLSGPGPHGRRLDFLTQELNREANTLGAKSVTAQTSQRAVDLKVIIEQIREQVQNIE